MDKYRLLTQLETIFEAARPEDKELVDFLAEAFLKEGVSDSIAKVMERLQKLISQSDGSPVEALRLAAKSAFENFAKRSKADPNEIKALAQTAVARGQKTLMAVTATVIFANALMAQYPAQAIDLVKKVKNQISTGKVQQPKTQPTEMGKPNPAQAPQQSPNVTEGISDYSDDFRKRVRSQMNPVERGIDHALDNPATRWIDKKVVKPVKKALHGKRPTERILARSGIEEAIDDPKVPCPSCGGHGNHGFEEESGNPYDCYRCYGEGEVPLSQLSPEERAEYDHYQDHLQGISGKSEMDPPEHRFTDDAGSMRDLNRRAPPRFENCSGAAVSAGVMNGIARPEAKKKKKKIKEADTEFQSIANMIRERGQKGISYRELSKYFPGDQIGFAIQRLEDSRAIRTVGFGMNRGQEMIYWNSPSKKGDAFDELMNTSPPKIIGNPGVHESEGPTIPIMKGGHSDYIIDQQFEIKVGYMVKDVENDRAGKITHIEKNVHSGTGPQDRIIIQWEDGWKSAGWVTRGKPRVRESAKTIDLMHLPAGAIAWLVDQPEAQRNAAKEIAIAAVEVGNPITHATLLRADPQVLILRDQGGMGKFHVYPDGGITFNGARLTGHEEVERAVGQAYPEQEHMQLPIAAAQPGGMRDFAQFEGAMMQDDPNEPEMVGDLPAQMPGPATDARDPTYQIASNDLGSSVTRSGNDLEAMAMKDPNYKLNRESIDLTWNDVV